MANVPIPENPEYSEIMRIIETTDLVHADIINPPLKTLILNTAYLYRRYQEIVDSMEAMAAGYIYGSTDLSQDATVVDSDAEFPVLRKVSSTAANIPLFSKQINLRKGLYSLLIRLKVSSNTDGNGLLKLQAGSEVRTITAKMFEKAGAYQTFGMNVECGSDLLSVSATVLKNSANITVSIDYIMLQPAQTAITSL